MLSWVRSIPRHERDLLWSISRIRDMLELWFFTVYPYLDAPKKNSSKGMWSRHVRGVVNANNERSFKKKRTSTSINARYSFDTLLFGYPVLTEHWPSFKMVYPQIRQEKSYPSGDLLPNCLCATIKHKIVNIFACLDRLDCNKYQ